MPETIRIQPRALGRTHAMLLTIQRDCHAYKHATVFAHSTEYALELRGRFLEMCRWDAIGPTRDSVLYKGCHIVFRRLTQHTYDRHCSPQPGRAIETRPVWFDHAVWFLTDVQYTQSHSYWSDS